MSFLEKEGEPQSALWDWVIGIGLVVLIAVGTAFYQYHKKSSNSRFAKADSLFQTGELVEAERLYEELKHAQYVTPYQDSMLYERLDSIAVLREQEQAALARITRLLHDGDTVQARRVRDGHPFRGFLPDADRKLLKSF